MRGASTVNESQFSVDLSSGHRIEGLRGLANSGLFRVDFGGPASVVTPREPVLFNR
jgi:hypothetical protein